MKNIHWLNHLIELFVVIVGVTIAFSLNNWNDERKARKLEQQYIQSLVHDLETDIEGLTTDIDAINHYLHLQTRLTQTVLANDLKHDSLFQFVISLLIFLEFTPQDNTYESMKASGNLEIIADFELKKQITTLYHQHYRAMSLIDELQKDLTFQKLAPYINQNLSLTDFTSMENLDFVKDKLFINLCNNSLYHLQQKLKFYNQALNAAIKLREKLESRL